VNRDRLIVVGPLPPPHHGVAVSTALVLANTLLRERFSISHLDTTDRRTIANMGTWDRQNISTGLRALVHLQWRLRGRRGVLYLPLSENAGGFVRDSLYIWSARLRRWSVAVHIRNSLFREFYGAQGRILKAWIRLTMRQVSSAAVLGENLRSLMDGFVAGDRVTVVRNGTPPFSDGAQGRDDDLVLYLSNISRKKGADHAVRAARLVAQMRPSAHFVFAGDWESSSFEKEIRSLASGMDGRLEFVGPIAGNARDELMARASVLLFPVAWGEGHPRIVLEAMAAGLPVVTTDRATIADTLGDGEGGFVLPDPDPDELAKKVLSLLDDPATRDRMGVAARERWRSRFRQELADQAITDWLASVARAREPESVGHGRA
jgi:glycosyltransferase involved in cell wall biosynthesis